MPYPYCLYRFEYLHFRYLICLVKILHFFFVGDPTKKTSRIKSCSSFSLQHPPPPTEKTTEFFSIQPTNKIYIFKPPPSTPQVLGFFSERVFVEVNPTLRLSADQALGQKWGMGGSDGVDCGGLTAIHPVGSPTKNNSWVIYNLLT